jgi:hypothetical protein
MKTMNHFRYLVPAAAAIMLLFSACRKETISLSMNATLEQPTADSSDSKNYLTNQENYIYWEDGDAIALSGSGNAGKTYTLTNGAGTRFGYFSGNVTVDKSGQTSLVAIYPSSSYVSATQLIYPAEMPYRSVSSIQDPDHSFGQNCFPMVATFKVNGENDGSSDIDFHSVSGLARVHIYSSLSTAAEISTIKFTSVAHGTDYKQRQISGQFVIGDVDGNAPYMKKDEGTGAGRYSITITGINKTVGGSAKGNFLTFYLPLPAYTPGTAGGSSAAANQTKYALTMVVTTNAGQTFTKTFGVDIRRNCITKMQALDITSWTAGTSTIGIVGCGTQERPFQIYTLSELKAVRNAFNTAAASNTAPVINGITVTGNTYFKVSRSDIVLTATEWDAGIKNFIGHFICSTANPTNFGITNNSQHPLFESVGTEGKVEYVSIQGNITYTQGTAESYAFSPLCGINNGTLDNCHNLCTVNSTASVAGLCVTNNGTINAGQNEASLTVSNTSAHIGGLCLKNNATGTVQGVTISTVRLNGNAVGGVCYDNEGLVKDCMVASTGTYGTTSVSSTGGLVVYTNESAGTIRNCYVEGALSTTGSVAGVVYNNEGLVDYCRSDLSITSSLYASGIAIYQKGSAAEIRNCSTPRSATSIMASTAAAGMVCYMQGGTISNSYNRAGIARTANTTVTGGIVAVLGATGSTTTPITIQNVYNSANGFFGTTATLTINEVTTNNVFSGATTVTLTNCYNFNSQDNLTNGSGVTKTVYKVSSLGSATNALGDALNTWKNAHGSSYYAWTPVQYPVLVNPSTSVTKSYRRTNCVGSGNYATNVSSSARHGSNATRIAAAKRQAGR